MTTTNVADRLEVIRHELYKWLSRKAWTRDCVSSRPDSVKVLQQLTDDMAAAGYPERDVVGVKVTLEHVIDHGLRSQVAPSPAVGLKISFHVDPDRVLVEVEDPRAEQDLQGLFAFRDLLDRRVRQHLQEIRRVATDRAARERLPGGEVSGRS